MAKKPYILEWIISSLNRVSSFLDPDFPYLYKYTKYFHGKQIGKAPSFPLKVGKNSIDVSM